MTSLVCPFLTRTAIWRRQFTTSLDVNWRNIASLKFPHRREDERNRLFSTLENVALLLWVEFFDGKAFGLKVRASLMGEVRYPKKWKEMSLDMKLMFGYHGSMMAMMMAGGSLSVRQELTMAAVMASLIVLLSRSNRQKKHWRWPGIRPVDVLYAVGSVFFISIFLYSASPLFPPNNGHIVPWYLACLGIGLFGVLQSLKVVYPSEAEFASNCKIVDLYGRELEPVQESSSARPSEANWKRVTKTTYTVMFTLLWICGVASFYFFGTAFKNGSPEPTVTQTEPLEDHGKTVYMTPTEKQRVRSLQLVSWVGVPVVLIGGAVLHFVVGVKLFPNTPTLSEYLNRGNKRVAP